MKLNIIVIVILGFSILFVTNEAYAPCIEGPGNNCNNYPPPALTQISTDKINYDISDKPLITIMGAPDAVAHLEIDLSSSNIMLFTHDISLAPNGTARYVLDISSYKPGVYSAIATSPISKLTSNFAVGLTTTGGSIMLNTDKNSYFPGDNVKIVGAWNPNTLIQLSLIDPSGISVKSTQIFLDKTGHFSSFDFSIPPITTYGTWKIDGTSGVNHVSVNITVNKIPGVNLDKTIILSPLKQFKSGIKVEDVKCSSNLHLIIKAEDSSFACVSIETGKQLALRGWATTFGTGMIVNDYNISCNVAYQQSDSGMTVLYMPTNSTGKICVRYYNLNNTPVGIGIRIFEENNMTQNAPDIITWASTNTLQGNDNATIVYSIKTGNKAGFYGLSLFCGGMPFAVGYDANSTLTASDFSGLEGIIHACPSQGYEYHIEGVKGIGIRYIPNSSNLP